MATGPTPPAERAQEIIQSVPSTSLVTKTGAVVLGSALTATAISQELYVVDGETVVLAGFLILTTYLAKVNR
jgi:F-type H+-transporting ATPase subunit b